MPFALRAPEPELAIMSRDDFLADPEPESRTLHTFGRENATNASAGFGVTLAFECRTDPVRGLGVVPLISRCYHLRWASSDPHPGREACDGTEFDRCYCRKADHDLMSSSSPSGKSAPSECRLLCVQIPYGTDLQPPMVTVPYSSRRNARRQEM